MGCALACALLAALLQQANAAQTFQQHNNIVQFYVQENAPAGTYLGTIMSSDGQVPYLVLPSPLTPEHERLQALNISLETGEVSTAAVLDREQREHYHFVALVQRPFAEIKCLVTVKDVNDNAPAFRLQNESQAFVIEMPENQKNVRRPLPLAYDLDSIPYSIAEFRIVSENTPRELFVLVEQGAPPRSSVAVADSQGADLIQAGKVDDPQLAQQLAQQQQVLIPSQAAPVQPLSSVGAQAVALGERARAQAGQRVLAAPPTKMHYIDLELNQPLDRENQSSYQLVVEAHDGGQPALVGKIKVTVLVQDANDNEPQFERKLYELQVREDTPKGTPVLRVQAHDADLDQNAQLSYFIKRTLSSSSASSSSSSPSAAAAAATAVVAIGPNPTGSSQQTSTSGGLLGQPASKPLFEIDPVKGEIRLAQLLDFETDSSHELIVEARDHGQPSRSGYTTVKIAVVDCYEEPPPKKALLPALAAANEAGRTNELALQPARAGQPAELGAHELQAAPQAFQLHHWFNQLNSSLFFILLLVALLAIAFPLCVVRMKIHQPEMDSNDTAGLTLASNNQTLPKPSPNHSLSNNEHHHQHQHHHHSNLTVANEYRYSEQQRRADPTHQRGLSMAPPACTISPAPMKLLYPYTDISNSYENLVHAPDRYAFYNMDYLADWAPEYQSVMALLQSDYALSYRQAAR